MPFQSLERMITGKSGVHYHIGAAAAHAVGVLALEDGSDLVFG